MYKPREFAFATPGDLGSSGYRQFCKISGLPRTQQGWGLLLVEDEETQRWTLGTPDVDYARSIAGSPREVLAGLEIPEGKFTWERRGWPDDWPTGTTGDPATGPRR